MWVSSGTHTPLDGSFPSLFFFCRTKNHPVHRYASHEKPFPSRVGHLTSQSLESLWMGDLYSCLLRLWPNWPQLLLFMLLHIRAQAADKAGPHGQGDLLTYPTSSHSSQPKQLYVWRCVFLCVSSFSSLLLCVALSLSLICGGVAVGVCAGVVLAGMWRFVYVSVCFVKTSFWTFESSGLEPS